MTATIDVLPEAIVNQRFMCAIASFCHGVPLWAVYEAMDAIDWDQPARPARRLAIVWAEALDLVFARRGLIFDKRKLAPSPPAKGRRQ